MKQFNCLQTNWLFWMGLLVLNNNTYKDLPQGNCPVGCGGDRIHQLHLCRGVRPSGNECPGYDIKQSNSEASVMLESWGMQSAPLLSSLPGPLWLRVVAPDRVLSMGQIELKCALMQNWITWNGTFLYLNCVLKWTTGTLAQRLECSPMARETWVQSQVESYQKTLKMELDTTLLNTQHYKVRFKGKVEKSREWSSALPYTLV